MSLLSKFWHSSTSSQGHQYVRLSVRGHHAAIHKSIWNYNASIANRLQLSEISSFPGAVDNWVWLIFDSHRKLTRVVLVENEQVVPPDSGTPFQNAYLNFDIQWGEPLKEPLVQWYNAIEGLAKNFGSKRLSEVREIVQRTGLTPPDLHIIVRVRNGEVSQFDLVVH